MNQMFCVFLLVGFSFNFVNAAGTCIEKASAIAAEEVAKLILDDWVNENDIKGKALKIEIKKPRLIKPKRKLQKGVAYGISVAYSIQYESEKLNYDHFFQFDKDCNRNVRAEIIRGKQTDEMFRKEKIKRPE